MTKSQYLEMMEQMGQEPDWDKCPVDWEDFPEVIILGINAYNSLGSRIFPEIGYIGKEYSNYDLILEYLGIEEHQKDFVFEIVQFMENREVEISQRKLKAEYDRVKRGK